MRLPHPRFTYAHGRQEEGEIVKIDYSACIDKLILLQHAQGLSRDQLGLLELLLDIRYGAK